VNKVEGNGEEIKKKEEEMKKLEEKLTKEHKLAIEAKSKEFEEFKAKYDKLE